MDDVFGLVEHLQSAADFQEGATRLLEDLREVAESEMTRIGGFDGVEWQRGILHVRNDGGYRHLAIVEREEAKSTESLRPSSTAWGLIEKHRAPVLIDVRLQEAQLIGTDSSFEWPGAGLKIDPNSSIRAIGRRETTHVLALPVPGLRGSLDGMVSLEFRCGALGRELDWRQLATSLHMRIIVGAPHVVTLPAPALTDDLTNALPVPSRWFAEQAPLLKVFAAQKQTVLIVGATGSGKTFLARWLHDNSPQKEGPFIVAPLNEISDDVGLPHLFGWTKGAFTGAKEGNPGWAPTAEGGTLFLDEIDTLSRTQQQGLLGFLDTGRFTVMGSGQQKQLNNVRFIAATNADLRTMVAEGSFREDLYHRVNGFVVEVPPLGDRRDEIPSWAQHFAAQMAPELGAGAISFTNEALSLLAQHSFPGNLRDLNKTVARACAHAMVAGQSSEGMVIDAPHVDAALDQGRSVSGDDPVSLLHRSAQSLVDEALRSQTGKVHEAVIAQKGLLFDMVWLVAVQSVGDSTQGDKQARPKVARMLDKEVSLQGNNYGTELKKSCQRLAKFYGDHACELPPELTRILGLS